MLLATMLLPVPPEVALWAFFDEHRRCGDLDGGVDDRGPAPRTACAVTPPSRHARYPHRATQVCIYRPVPSRTLSELHVSWAILEHKETTPAMLSNPTRSVPGATQN
jgi:hypothetical protein